jgi:hypothetical protein
VPNNTITHTCVDDTLELHYTNALDDSIQGTKDRGGKKEVIKISLIVKFIMEKSYDVAKITIARIQEDAPQLNSPSPSLFFSVYMHIPARLVRPLSPTPLSPSFGGKPGLPNKHKRLSTPSEYLFFFSPFSLHFSFRYRL